MIKKEKELNPEEIQQLFDFLQSKYVRYKDVQYELVDHLASGIEEKQRADKNLNFESALREVYAGFPVTGFNDFLTERTTALTKYFQHKLWNYMKDYLKLPKIIISIIVYCTFFQLFSTFHSYSIIVSFVILNVIFGVSLHRQGLRKTTRNNSNYLVLATYSNVITSAMFFFFNIPVYQIIFTLPENIQLAPIALHMFAIIFSMTAFYIHAFIFVFPNMLKEEIETKYAHLQISYN